MYDTDKGSHIKNSRETTKEDAPYEGRSQWDKEAPLGNSPMRRGPVIREWTGTPRGVAIYGKWVGTATPLMRETRSMPSPGVGGHLCGP